MKITKSNKDFVTIIFLMKDKNIINKLAVFQRNKYELFYNEKSLICENGALGSYFTKYSNLNISQFEELEKINESIGFEKLFSDGSCNEESKSRITDALRDYFNFKSTEIKSCYKSLKTIANQSDPFAESALLMYLLNISNNLNSIKEGKMPFIINCKENDENYRSKVFAKVNEDEVPKITFFTSNNEIMKKHALAGLKASVSKNNETVDVINHELLHSSQKHLWSGNDKECIDEKYNIVLANFCSIDGSDREKYVNNKSVSGRVIDACINKSDQIALVKTNVEGVLQISKNDISTSDGAGHATNGMGMLTQATISIPQATAAVANTTLQGSDGVKRDPFSGEAAIPGENNLAQAVATVSIPATTAAPLLQQGNKVVTVLTDEVESVSNVLKTYNIDSMDPQSTSRNTFISNPVVKSAMEGLSKTVDNVAKFVDNTTRTLTAASPTSVSIAGNKITPEATLIATSNFGPDISNNLIREVYLGESSPLPGSKSYLAQKADLDKKLQASKAAFQKVEEASAQSKLSATSGRPAAATKTSPTRSVASMNNGTSIGQNANANLAALNTQASPASNTALETNTETDSNSEPRQEGNSTRNPAAISPSAPGSVTVRDNRILQTLSVMTKVAGPRYLQIRSALQQDPKAKEDLVRRGFAIMDQQRKPIVGEPKSAKVCFQDNKEYLERINCR